jgi:DNA polymerase-3 subunit epsilon
MNSRRYVICDIEATGLDEDKDLIEIALITFQDDKVIDVYETLINPLRSVPEFIQNLTSISIRDLQSAPKFYEVADAIRMRLEGGVFVSHNTDFDLNLLKKKYHEMGQELKLKDFCTLKIAQDEIPGLKNYNLDALCSFFGIKIKERHRAIGDARATLELFKELQDLRFKVYPQARFLPQHEKILNRVPGRAGLLKFKDAEGKVLRLEAAFNCQVRARALLEIRKENREMLSKTETVQVEVTGSALIAEIKKMLQRPPRLDWMIISQEMKRGEKTFRMRPYKKGAFGLWYFSKFHDAKKKLISLNKQLLEDTYAYREDDKSKEEIIRNNQKVDILSKEAKFPADNLVILGEGRALGEKSLILIRKGHVQGFGYSSAPDEVIFEWPEKYLMQRFNKHIGVNLVAMNYLRVLKNQRNKTEYWRSLSDHANMREIHGE